MNLTTDGHLLKRERRKVTKRRVPTTRRTRHGAAKDGRKQTTATMAISSSPPPPLSLSTEDFEVALASHIDESKPDPLVKRLFNSLILEWASQTEQQQGTADATDAGGAETKRMCGTLTLYGDYMAVTISSNCSWMWRPCAEEVNGCAIATLSFRLAASAKFIHRANTSQQMERSKRQGGDQSPKVDRKEQRAHAKRRAGMIDRLQKDYYIKRLLAPLDGDSKVSDQKQQQHTSTICEAEIKESFGTDGKRKELEERVDVSEDVLEGIRRAILSHLDENTSVLDLLLCFPYLINALIETRKDDKGNDISLQLGHRAILRLLEDACIDACEKEGEDELLDDLQISTRIGNGDDDDSVESSGGRFSGQATRPLKKKSKQ